SWKARPGPSGSPAVETSAHAVSRPVPSLARSTGGIESSGIGAPTAKIRPYGPIGSQVSPVHCVTEAPSCSRPTSKYEFVAPPHPPDHVTVASGGHGSSDSHMPTSTSHAASA